jgi:hypothetical protein
MADKETAPSRQEVISLVARHAKQLSDLAQSHGCETVHYFLNLAAQEAERELATMSPREDGPNSG